MLSALRASLLLAAIIFFFLILPTSSLAVPSSCPDQNTCDDQSGAPGGNNCKPIGANNSYNECCGTGLSRNVIRSRTSDGVCAYSVGDCNQQDAACNNYGGGSNNSTPPPSTEGTGSTGSGISSVNALSTLNLGGTEVPVDSSNYHAQQNADFSIQNLLHGTLCTLVGMSPVGQCIGFNAQKVGLNPSSSDISTVLYTPGAGGGGALGTLNNTMIAMVDTPPASTGLYLADIGQQVGLVSPAYAQVTGSGSNIIQPIESVWELTRNLAYLGFIVIFLVVGFMIMFRQKINPQTVISVQAALPSLVLGIILVTFSYFIASVIIDLAFVGVQVVASIFEMMKGNVFDIPALANSSNVFHMFVSSFRIPENIKDVFTGSFSTLGSSGVSTGLTVAGVTAGIAGAILTLTGIGAGIGIPLMIGGGAGAAGSVLAPGILSLLVPVILIIALLIQFFRLLIKLIMAYITLIILTVTGPLVILISSIPGRGKGIENWWKTLLANSLVFPAVFGAFLFAGLILGTDSTAWNAAPPLFGGLSTELLRLIIAYGIILATPGIPDMVKGAFGVKDIPLGGVAIGGAMAGFAVAKGSANKGWKVALGPLDKQREMRLNEYAKFQAGVPSKAGVVTAYPGWAGRFRSWYTNRGLPRGARNPFGGP